jgi:hypothetical protein
MLGGHLVRTDRLVELAGIAAVAAICLCYAVTARAQVVRGAENARATALEFEGTPVLKVEVSDGAVQTLPVPKQTSLKYGVRVERTPTGYVWASRNNVPLVRVESGDYVTYTATTGAGYLRVLAPVMRKALLALPDGEREKEFVYMEHMVHRMGSITYFGK